MGKLRELALRYTNQSNGVYLAGDEVKGELSLSLDEPMDVRSLSVEVAGFAYTHWTVSRSKSTGSGKSKRTRRVTEHYSARQSYLDKKIVLFGDGTNKQQLKAGSHKYSFTFTLPANAPTSFEGTYGHVRYKCVGIVDSAWWKINNKTQKMFSCVAKVDLNDIPSAKESATVNKDKVLGIGCCKAGTILANVQLERQGFVAGEQLLVKVQIENASKRIMDHILVELEQKATYVGKRGRSNNYPAEAGFAAGGFQHTRQGKKVVARKVLEQGMKPGETKDYSAAEVFRIPSVPPIFINCAIIKLEYVVHLEVDPAGPHADLDVRVPITIGSVPLDTVSKGNSVPVAYEQSTFGAAAVKDENGGDKDTVNAGEKWAPSYPVFGLAKGKLPTAPQQEEEAPQGAETPQDDSDGE